MTSVHVKLTSLKKIAILSLEFPANLKENYLFNNFSG